jgi:hypothetical protein
MNKKMILLLWACFPLFCIAQQPLSLDRGYDYDEAGNRILRKVVNLKIIEEPPPAFTPPPPNDSLQVTSDELQVTEEFPLAQFFVETIAQVEIKIYPNPSTEKITMEIANMQNLTAGVFKLYSLTGQLLQEHPVHSVATEVSLSGLARGTYILKVQINDHIEDWKIIKI